MSDVHRKIGYSKTARLEAENLGLRTRNEALESWLRRYKEEDGFVTGEERLAAYALVAEEVPDAKR